MYVGISSQLYESQGLTFLPNEGEGPGEDIHEVGQPVGVVHRIELTNVHHIVLVLQDGRCRGQRSEFKGASSLRE